MNSKTDKFRYLCLDPVGDAQDCCRLQLESMLLTTKKKYRI
jgi:hypothetical protein